MHEAARMPSVEGAELAVQVQALRQVALAVARPGGPDVFGELMRVLTEALAVNVAFVALFQDDTRAALRTLAAQVDGKALQPFDYTLEGTPCAQVVGSEFRYAARGVAREFTPGTLFAAKGMDSYAAYPLTDGAGMPLGLLVTMDRRPIAGGDAGHAESMLKIVAGRLVAEIERSRTDEVLRTAALAVSGARSGTVFDELVRLLATVLHVEVAFVARYGAEDPAAMRILAMHADGQIVRDMRYPVAGTPCETVLGQRFRAYPTGVRRLFPQDEDFQAQCTEGYAGFPLEALDGTPLGIVSVWSRRPLVQVERIESMLKIFAVRAAAEIERLAASEALARSEASYRAIFDAAEDAIFIHDWDTGRIVDVNPKACETFGYPREALCALSVSDISSGVPPYTGERAQALMALARLGRCPPVEWHRRNRDGSLHWDELRMKPAMLDGRPYILAFSREITARKAAEDALRDREEQYRAVFEGTADALVIWSAEMRIVDVNRAFSQLFGFAREDVIGRSFGRRLPPDQIAQRSTLIRAALAGQEGQLEARMERKDGSGFDVELRYLPITYRGEPHVLAIARDVTERREREAALLRSEAQYRAIFNASADALVLRAADFSIVDVNATYESMSGFTRAEVLGVDRVLANPPEVSATIRALHTRALAGETVALDTELVRRDGERYHLELRGVPIQHRGQPHVLYMGRDITAGKRAEQARRDSEEQYRAVFKASADGLVLRDADFRIVEVNPAYLAMTGFTREQALGATHILTPSAMEDERSREAHGRVLGGELLRIEVTETRRDGSTFEAEVRGMPVAYGGQPHVLYVLRDITARRQAEQQRADLEHQLRQAQKMEAIGQLTGGIAHDFNNILTSVIGYLVLAEERADTIADATLARQLGQAHLAAERARELIAQMLAFARRQRGERRVLALAPLVRQTLSLLRASLPTSVEFDVDLPALETAGTGVEADPVQLEQVLFNLCINAGDAMDGRGRIGVQLRAVEGGRWSCASCRAPVAGGPWVELSVSDSGSGISPALMERIFDPFFSTKAPGRGSGMGLAMVHGIVHEHGGHLHVRTDPGRGSVFSVRLPVAAGPSGRDTPAPVNGPRHEPGLQGRVLVVEDDPMVGEFLAERLRSWGLEVELQREPQRAAEWLQDPANVAALLLTDQTMPQMTGLELAARARAARPTLPIVLMSGNATRFEPGELQACGVQDALSKPLDNERLRAVLRDSLAGG